MTTTNQITLTSEQQKAVDMACTFIDAQGEEGDLLRIGGWAGTGKSTILKTITEQFMQLGICAYTGKAANVLQRKGMDAHTIHSLIYEFDSDLEEFFLKSEVPFNGFAIDEASMLGAELFTDLSSFGLPILAIGDPGQLPPISKYDINLMEEPDFVLQKIHRQAKGNPIIELATQIRLEGIPEDFHSDNAVVTTTGNIFDDLLTPDIVLCGMNATRCLMNREIRAAKGYTDDLCPGEKIICLKNDKKKLGVFNGQIFTVEEILQSDFKAYWCRLIDEENNPRYLWVSTRSLGKEKGVDFKESRSTWGKHMIADYANCITVHKSQGSEYDNVAIIREQAPHLWEQRRWDYTAVTRAAQTVKVYQ